MSGFSPGGIAGAVAAEDGGDIPTTICRVAAFALLGFVSFEAGRMIGESMWRRYVADDDANRRGELSR